MRHRSPRPLLDRLTHRPSWVAVRRMLIVATAVTVVFGAGVLALDDSDAPAGGQAARITAVAPTSSSVAPTDEQPKSDRSTSAKRRLRPDASRSAAASPSTKQPAPTGSTLPSTTQTGPDTAGPSPTARGSSAKASKQASPSAGSSGSSGSTGSSGSASTSPSGSPADTVPPDTSAVTQSLVGMLWTVAATSTEPGSTFECQLDGSAFQVCPALMAVQLVTPGSHTLTVRSVDPAGNVDPTPAVVTTEVPEAGS